MVAVATPHHNGVHERVDDLPHFDLYYGGAWHAPANGDYAPMRNPSTGNAIGMYAQATVDDVRRAVLAARSAFDEGGWSDLAPAERSRRMHLIVDLLEARQEELAEADILNGGCTWRKASLVDVPLGLLQLRHFADLANYDPVEPIKQVTYPSLSYNYVRREPIGVCGQIIPWNFPFLFSIWKIGPALAAGCTVVLKPASYTPLSALRLAEMIHDSGLLPPGVLNLVTGPGGVVGPELCNNPLVDKIAFTGSTEVGRDVMRQSASTIKKVTLELGGKSPNILLDDADLDIAIDGALWATFMHNGQACESGTRLFVPEHMHDEVVERLVARASRMTLGNADDGTTDVGPLISPEQLATVERYIALGLREGATPALLGKRPTDADLQGGYYISPTIFANVSNSMRIAQEEIFGPVLCVIPYKSVDEAIRLANDTIYGLAAGVWSVDVERAVGVANQIKAGTVWINDYHILPPEAPFGGYKQSGIGRELGKYGLEEYLEVKHIHVALDSRRSSRFYYDVVVPGE